MCGVFGVFGTREHPEQALLEAMGAVLHHRGPDGGGVHVDGSLAIGMKRLSIIDLATGDQPMANEDRSVWVVFNGEIYNYRELREQLLQRGHRFSTASDTEVLVHLYEERGEACVEPLRGMFAFAIWDSPRRTLLLGRDRLGIKPLYYADTVDGLVFGSELKAVTRSPWVSRRVDRRALAGYLQFGYVPDPLTILRDVAKLPPGHTLTIKDGRSSSPRRYWDPSRSFGGHSSVRGEEEAADALEAALTDAVRSHLVSDVPVGIFLSGGVDSSAVLWMASRAAGASMKAFTVGFREEGFDESPQARLVANYFGADLHEFIADRADLGVLEKVLRAFDEPFADASAIPVYMLSQLAREHVKVVLSGDGGDELFAGYDRYVTDHRRRLSARLGATALGGLLRGLSDALPEGTAGKRYLYNLSLSRIERYRDSISYFPPRTLSGLLESVDDPLRNEDGFEERFRGAESLDVLSQLQLIDLQTYLPGDILTKLDRMTMAHSLEARVPILDHLLVEFACALPTWLRMRGDETKYLLKKILRNKVPPEVLDRPKQGFAVPLERWFAGDLAGFFTDVLGEGSRLAAAGFRQSRIRELIELYQRKGREDNCRQLWSLAVLDQSLQTLMHPATQ